MAIALLPLPLVGEHACGLKAVYPRRIEFEQKLVRVVRVAGFEPALN